MPYQLCRHIKTNGRRCDSPALIDKSWCFYHARLHTRHRFIREAKPTESKTPLHIPSLEDAESIQVGISLVVEALATGRLDLKRAAVLIRGLQAASRNVVQVRNEPSHCYVVREFTPTLDGLALAPAITNDRAPVPSALIDEMATALLTDKKLAAEVFGDYEDYEEDEDDEEDEEDEDDEEEDEEENEIS